jgi:hypothetical protein|nr:hypothetical protein JVH1_4980 [Rhodococcus sp. JVH1]
MHSDESAPHPAVPPAPWTIPRGLIALPATTYIGAPTPGGRDRSRMTKTADHKIDSESIVTRDTLRREK